MDEPYGREHRFRKVNVIGGGWRVNGITTLHSGLSVPFGAGGTNYLSQYFGANAIRPNVVTGCIKNVQGSQQSEAGKWLNTSSFSQPGPFSFGNERRVDSNIRSAGAANFDFFANKTFPIYDRFTGRFSVETFNLFIRAHSPRRTAT